MTLMILWHCNNRQHGFVSSGKRLCKCWLIIIIIKLFFVDVSAVYSFKHWWPGWKYHCYFWNGESHFGSHCKVKIVLKTGIKCISQNENENFYKWNLILYFTFTEGGSKHNRTISVEVDISKSSVLTMPIQVWISCGEQFVSPGCKYTCTVVILFLLWKRFVWNVTKTH